ncbi:hypothetical protein OG474_14300 [Kribbella sp. NBC_01505]|uniref:hypothetical protein n=1 Tax=Kribbella sp. NBC_01505 TaxID=2903580 RepID=UPI00386DF10F
MRSSRPTLELTRYAELQPPEPTDELVSVSIGPTGEAAALWASPADATTLSEGDFRVGPVSRAVSVRAALHSPDLVQVVSIPDFRLRCSMVQPMPGGAFLTVAPRIRPWPDGVPPNATIHDAAGNLQAEGVLGDGIEHIQTTESGQIWVGYFDEGVYGHLYWGSAAVGGAGLLRFTPDLMVDWTYSAADAGLEIIDDCYALNVVGETAWCCYYADFSLIAVQANAVRSWRNKVRGARAILVHDNRVALYGGYSNHRHRLVTAHRDQKALTNYRDYRLVLPGGKRIPRARTFARGSTLHIFADRTWYRLDLADLP